jgi:hypothetical protein
MTPRYDSTRQRLLDLLGFSIRSLGQAYGHTFAQRMVLQHPLRALRGLLTYWRTLSSGSAQERAILGCDEDEFVMRAAGDGERLLVATGFCQKPVSSAGDAQDCPAGRFNHDCRCLSRLRVDSGATRLHPACADCSIRALGHAALKAGASVAVLTSALDIAHDILIPALETQRFRRILFAICPYSVEPMSLALAICGLEGYILAYDSGACANYTEWLRADGGDKPERTTLSAHKVDRLLHLLDRIAAVRKERTLPRAACYVREGDIFAPR